MRLAVVGSVLLIAAAATLAVVSALVEREIRRTEAAVQRLHVLRVALDALTIQAKATGVAIARTGDSVGEVPPR